MSDTFDGQAINHFLCLFRSVLLSEHGIDHSLNLPHLHHLQGLFPTGHRQGSTLAQKGELFNYRSQEGEGGFLFWSGEENYRCYYVQKEGTLVSNELANT